jgi:general secretion pathway protein C
MRSNSVLDARFQVKFARMLSYLSTADQARLSRLAALTACAGAGVVCLWLLVRLAWLLVPQADDVAASTPSAAPATTTASPSVAKWHLFGNPQNVMLATAAHAPATTLKLVLRGTLALPEPQEGMAVIEDEHGAERSYKVGEDVADGAKLAEVYADHVVLSHEGATETLNLPQPEAHAPPLPDPNQRNLAVSMGGGAATKPGGAPSTYAPPQIPHGAVDWNQVQKNLRTDPEKLAKQVHFEPVFIDGKITGARLSGSGEVAALMNQVGLKPTDMITAVNGTAVAGLSNPQQFMDNFKNASSLQVTVLRDGKPATLTLNLH